MRPCSRFFPGLRSLHCSSGVTSTAGAVAPRCAGRSPALSWSCSRISALRSYSKSSCDAADVSPISVLTEHPLWWEIGALLALLVVSAFFSIAETAMMAVNRYRLQHLVSGGHRGAARVAELLKRTDRLLGGILIGN